MAVKNKKITFPKIKLFVWQTFSWIVIFTLILSVIIPLTFAVFFRNRLYPNILVGPHSLGGKTKEEASLYLSNYYKNISNFQFRLTYQEKSWDFTGRDWGIQLSVEKTIDKAYRFGRDPSIFTNIGTLLQSYHQAVNIPLLFTVDEILFSQSINKITDEINKPLIFPILVVEKDKVSLTPGTPGKKLDTEILKEKLTGIIAKDSLYTVSLPVITLNPPMGKNEAEQTRIRAEKLLSKKATLVIGENYYDLLDQELVNLLSFSGGFDKEKIASLTANLSRAYDRDAQNAMFNFENNRVTAFKPGIPGQKINQEKALPFIDDILTNLEATTSSTLQVNLPILTTEPEITTEKANDLGIRELLGKGSSYFYGSIASRVHNIVLASAKLNGILIKPGETFSFNNAVGDISGATGFQQAYVIQNGRTVLGDGGGVCQVSSTLFRAALYSGLPIIERTAHAYRVSYYEDGGFGPGLDATVFAPSVDLKFKNDTASHILIQTVIDKSKSFLSFELYGSADGRVATVSKPRVWDQTPPPPPKYEDDPTLPIGTEKQVDFAAWGAKAAFDYKVVRGEEILINRTFYSTFRPWQAVYLRGTRQ